MCCGCDTSYIESVNFQCQASIYTLSLCHGHSWRVRLAKQETLTPPGHLVSPLVCRGPWMSTVVLYCLCQSDSASVLLYFTFQYLWNPENDLIKLKFSENVSWTHYCWFCKSGSFEKWNYFCSKNTFLTQKCKITIIMCSDNVFSITLWDFIKIDSKLQKLQPFSSIYTNEQLVEFQKLWLLHNVFIYPHRLTPSIVATRKVKWCMFYHYFDKQSSLKSFINKL